MIIWLHVMDVKICNEFASDNIFSLTVFDFILLAGI